MAKKHKHITLDDRAFIPTQLWQGFKPGAIAVSLNRPRLCITRELARNGWRVSAVTRHVAGGYSSSRANLCACRLVVMPRVEPKLVVGNSL